MGGRTWTKEEDAKLRTIWPQWAKTAVYEQFPRRHPKAIDRHAHVLGLRRPRHRAWKDGAEPLFAELRRARETAGLSREELSRKLGYHLQIVGRWERGECAPNWFAFRAWLKALSMNVKIFAADRPIEERIEAARAKRVCLRCEKPLRTAARHQFLCAACRAFAESAAA